MLERKKEGFVQVSRRDQSWDNELCKASFEFHRGLLELAVPTIVWNVRGEEFVEFWYRTAWETSARSLNVVFYLPETKNSKRLLLALQFSLKNGEKFSIWAQHNILQGYV